VARHVGHSVDLGDSRSIERLEAEGTGSSHRHTYIGSPGPRSSGARVVGFVLLNHPIATAACVSTDCDETDDPASRSSNGEFQA
jgi:hypothetical protein